MYGGKAVGISLCHPGGDVSAWEVTLRNTVMLSRQAEKHQEVESPQKRLSLKLITRSSSQTWERKIEEIKDTGMRKHTYSQKILSWKGPTKLIRSILLKEGP